MNFDCIASSITYGDVKIARNRFRGLMLELGCRKNNEHIGTGLGGNNFQLITLMNFQHELSTDSFSIQIKSDKIIWGSEWFISSPLKDIRHELDKQFLSLNEKYKYLTLALENYPSALRKGFYENKEQFPKLTKALDGKPFIVDHTMSRLDKLITAYILCQELSVDLDAGVFNSIEPMAVALVQFPSEVILLAVRRYLQIERLVKYNLDEHSEFRKVLNIVLDDIKYWEKNAYRNRATDC